MQDSTKLIFIKTSGEYIDELMETLKTYEFSATLIANNSGLLQYGSAIVMAGVPYTRYEEFVVLLSEQFKNKSESNSEKTKMEIYAINEHVNPLFRSED